MNEDCFQYIKGTKKKANHNYYSVICFSYQIVSNTSKVLKRKQITTSTTRWYFSFNCFQYIKGTKKKANHNHRCSLAPASRIVSNTSKVLKRKQITTYLGVPTTIVDCFQYIKGTKKKANHNNNNF